MVDGSRLRWTFHGDMLAIEGTTDVQEISVGGELLADIHPSLRSGWRLDHLILVRRDDSLHKDGDIVVWHVETI